MENESSNRSMLTPHSLYDEVVAILSGLIGGGRYGLKIRVPHALVMTFLFGSNLSFIKKLHLIAKLALEHASNLAAFAFSYKLILAALKAVSQKIRQSSGSLKSTSRHHVMKALVCLIVDGPQILRKQSSSVDTISTPGIPAQPYHSFLAGAFGGYFVWGRYSGVNYQLLLYLVSRILVASIKLASEKGVWPFSSKRLMFPKVYPWAAAGIWGTVMMLFEEFPDVLHPSLKRSMDEIYRFNLSPSRTDLNE
eukprot:CCRYP_020686-RB/>CCRYP_020686-RB protein AED:0.36 eAED:0.36 QI:144/1/1/1/0/0/6/381/250